MFPPQDKVMSFIYIFQDKVISFIHIFQDKVMSPREKKSDLGREFLTLMSVCHTVVPEKVTKH